MNLDLVRLRSTEHSITGKLAIEGVFECNTLERPYDDPDWKPIPEGKYLVTIRNSARFKRPMPHIESVPGREGILIHWGNHASDSEGCIIVGKQLGDDAVWESRVAFEALFVKLNNSKEPIYITVSKGDQSEKTT